MSEVVERKWKKARTPASYWEQYNSRMEQSQYYIRTTGGREVDAHHYPTQIELYNEGKLAYKDMLFVVPYKIEIFTDPDCKVLKSTVQDEFKYKQGDPYVRHYFTFGFGHYDRQGMSLANCYTIISARSESEARFRMIKWWGLQWSHYYPSAEEAGVDKYNLKLVI